MTLHLDRNLDHTYYVNDFAKFTRYGRYFYDTRVSNITYGVISKGSAILRASELNWFGKEINEIKFPQRNKSI